MRLSVQRNPWQLIDITEQNLAFPVEKGRIVDAPEVMRHPHFECSFQFVDRAIDTLGCFVLEDEAIPRLVRVPDLKVHQAEHGRGRHRGGQDERKRKSHR